MIASRMQAAWRIAGAGLLLLSCAALPAAAQGCEATNASAAAVIDETFTRPATFPWQGEFLQDDAICFPSRQSGAELRAYLLAPADVAWRADASLPVVVIGPGSGSSQALYYLWAARELAGHGYLALVVDPQGAGRSQVNGDAQHCDVEGCPGVPFQRADNYVDGFISGLDFVHGSAHAWLRKADRARIGIAGHSLSARAASYLGGVDERVRAVVAWDNLSSTLEGDAGVSSGGGDCGTLIGGEVPGESRPVAIRVPTLGQASDRVPGCDPANRDPELKKTGYERWRAAGVPSMEVVIRDAVHGDWAQSRQSVSAQLELFQYYTRAWFDLYLREDPTARERLLADPLVLSTTSALRSQLLSGTFRSAAFMPEAGIDCADLAAAPCLPPLPPLPPVLAAIADQQIDEDGFIAALPLQIADGDTPPAQLQVEATSDNPTLLPAGSLRIGAAGGEHYLEIRPAADASGSASITVTVGDGSAVATRAFVLTVHPVNDAPRISGLRDLIVDESRSVHFTLNLADVDDPASALSVAADSDHPELVPASNVRVAGAGEMRQVTVTPVTGRSGEAIITLTVSDGRLSSAGMFRLNVRERQAPPPAQDSQPEARDKVDLPSA